MQNGGIPRVVSGVEHEYKWLVTHPTVPGFDSGPHGIVRRVGMPADFCLAPQVTTVQSAVYLDTADALLAAEGISLAVVVNYGPNRHIRWLVMKETLLWAQGRRDALEIADRIDGVALSEALTTWSAQPLIRLGRRFGGPLSLHAFGAATQRRTQARAVSEFGTLGMSVDETTIRDTHNRAVSVDRWLEVETNQSELRCLRGLTEWADLISAALGSSPFEESKPERIARLARAGHAA
ncbi:hypothetical protein [Mangrovihabitans endophyticus]|nr:hypothetical protein [Mangrovihabitans endophyticus]